MNRDGFGSGKSDPFLIFVDENGKEVLRTETIDDELNPKWTTDKASAKFKIPYATAQAKPNATLEIQVWNWNAMKNDFLGGTRLTVSDLFAQNAAVVGEHTVDLEPRDKESDSTVSKAGKGKLGTITYQCKVKVEMA